MSQPERMNRKRKKKSKKLIEKESEGGTKCTVLSFKPSINKNGIKRMSEFKPQLETTPISSQHLQACTATQKVFLDKYTKRNLSCPVF